MKRTIVFLGLGLLVAQLLTACKPSGEGTPPPATTNAPPMTNAPAH